MVYFFLIGELNSEHHDDASKMSWIFPEVLKNAYQKFQVSAQMKTQNTRSNQAAFYVVRLIPVKTVEALLKNNNVVPSKNVVLAFRRCQISFGKSLIFRTIFEYFSTNFSDNFLRDLI